MSPDYIFTALVLSLLLTLILETGFSLIFKIRGKALLIVLLVNVLTNPVVVVLHLLLCRYYFCPETAVVFVLEACAVLAEAMIYKTRSDSFSRPFLFSLGANVFSFFCGAFINALI